MRNNVLKTVLFFSLFLAMISLVGYAELTYTDNISSPVTIYSPTTYSNFSITWNDTSGNVNAYLENNFTGSFTNTSMLGNYPEYYYNSSVLAANTYQYRFVANNSSGNENATPIFYFTINKADNPVNLYLNDTLNGNRTYIYTQIINATATSTVGTVYLYRDELSKGTNEQVLLSAETYAYKVNATGNENYSDNSGIIYYAIVNKAPTNINLWLDRTEGSRSYNQNDIANFTAQVNVTGLVINLTSNYPGWNELTNATTIYNTTDLSSIGIFSITGYTNGSNNYTASSQTYYFDTREPQYSDLIFSPSNNSPYFPNQNYSFNITLTDASINTIIFRFYNITPTGGGTVNYNIINPSSISINDTSKTFYVNITDLPAGSYNYSWYANDSLGKFNSTGNLTYIVVKGDAIGALTASPSTSVNSGTQTIVTCPNLNSNAGRSEVAVTLNLEQTSVSNPHITSLGVGTWNYYCTATNTGNYTNVQKSIQINVTSTGNTGNTGTGTGTVTSGSFSIKDLSSSNLAISAGESKSMTFKLSNTYTNNLQNVNISLSGINSSWYALSRKTLNLTHGLTETITLTFNIPSSAGIKNYDVNITAKGSDILTKIVRTATSSMKLNVTGSTQAVATPLTENSSASSANETQNATSGNELVGPTGLSVTFEYLKNNILIIIAIAACVLIFLFRDNVNENLAKVTSGKTYKSYKGPSIDFSSLRDKLNKMPNLRKKGRAKDLGPEKPGIRRPEVLEREIKRDIKELQHVIDTEKMMNKKKKFDAENN